MSEGTGKHSHQRYQSLLIIHLALFAKYASTTLALSFFDNYSRRDILKKASAATSIAFSITQPISASADTVLLPGGSAAFNPQIVGEWNNMPAMLQTKLGKSRILADELSPLSQPLLGDQELYYPPFLFGAWNVTATLKQKIYPYGTQYVPSYSLIEGSPRNRNEQVGNTCQYEVHYFSTIADTLANQATVNLGLGVPKTKIIQDRAFNAVSISKSYKQLLPVEDVVWDYSKDPSRVQLNVAPGALSEDMQPLGPRRTEIFLTARQSDQLDENVFCSAERSRSVTLLTRNGIVSDSETVTEFHKKSPNHVAAISRIAVYLTPNPNSREGVLWQQTGGKAIAFFDYELDMRHMKELFTLKDGTLEERACVNTPRDVVQCY